MHNICIDGNLRLLQVGSATTRQKSGEKYDNKTRNLYDRHRRKHEEEQERKIERKHRIRSQRDSFKRSTKIIQISSGKMRKTKQQRGRDRERGKKGYNPITKQQEATTNELIMLQVKAKKQMKWKWWREEERGKKLLWQQPSRA